MKNAMARKKAEEEEEAREEARMAQVINDLERAEYERLKSKFQ